MTQATSSPPAQGWVPADTFGTRLLLARKHAGLSVRDAAARCGLNYASWSAWERGALPSDLQSVVAQATQALGVDRDWLMWGGPLAPPEPRGPIRRRSRGGVNADTPETPNEVTGEYLRLRAA
jgi:transcriptional regulator with XRE-family HTH domain